MLSVLLLGTYLAGGNIEKGDELVRAQLELMKLSYFCDDPLYRSKRDAIRRSVARLDGNTSFKIESITDLDSSLKNNAVTLSMPLNRGDCIALIFEAQEKVDRLSEELNH
jgi:hypothetical protein